MGQTYVHYLYLLKGAVQHNVFSMLKVTLLIQKQRVQPSLSTYLSSSDCFEGTPATCRCSCLDTGCHLWPSSFLFVPFTLLSDPLHAYLGLCGLSLIGEPSLRKVHPALNITQRAFQHLQHLQQTWRDNTGSCSRQHWQHDASEQV